MENEHLSPAPPRPPIAKSLIAGLLMGVANLIPGVSGGTMILAMGLYTEFIDSVADVTALRFRSRRFVFLGIVAAGAAAAIVGLAPVILYLLFNHDSAMYALFIGLTLGGAPTLIRSIRPVGASAVIGTIGGVGAMVAIVLTRDRAVLPQNTVMDVVAGAVAAVTMVLPGISGSYMLLIMGQYDRVLRAIELRDLHIIVPVGIGVLIGIVLLSNALKFLLHRFQKPTVGVLLGMLLGSVLGLWPFGREPSTDALEARQATELLRFAERKGVAVDAGLGRQELVGQIIRQWDDRDRGEDYSPMTVAVALVVAACGFMATWSLSKRGTTLGNPGRSGMTPESQLPSSQGTA